MFGLWVGMGCEEGSRLGCMEGLRLGCKDGVGLGWVGWGGVGWGGVGAHPPRCDRRGESAGAFTISSRKIWREASRWA